MSESQISYFSEKVFIHHWPKDSPLWGEPLQKKFDECINKNSNSKKLLLILKLFQLKIFLLQILKKLVYLYLFLKMNVP